MVPDMLLYRGHKSRVLFNSYNIILKTSAKHFKLLSCLIEIKISGVLLLLVFECVYQKHSNICATQFGGF